MTYSPIIKDQPNNLLVKRIITIGDPHFGVGANDDYFFRSMVTYFREVVIPWLEQNLRPGDVVHFTGDIFDNDTVIRTEVNDAVISIFERIAALVAVTVTTGNHDVVRKRSNEVNSLRGIGHIAGVHIYYQPFAWNTAYDKKMLFYPWMKDIESLDALQTAANNGCKILLSHAHFNGLAFDNEFIKKKDGEVKSIDAKDLKMFDLVINGHIHAKQDLHNILNVGAPYQLTYNDEKNKCGIHIVDLENYKVQFIENKFSPRFYRNDILKFLNMTKPEANAEINNKLVRVSYPADLAKTFSMDSIRRELFGFVDMDFVPEYTYGEKEISESDAKAPEVVDLKKILSNVADTLQLPKPYTSSLVEDLQTLYNKHAREESLDI